MSIKEVKQLEDQTQQVTYLLKCISDGDTSARDKLIETLYKELKAMALKLGAREEHTLSPSVLAHDAYMRLVEKKSSFGDRFQFMSAVAQTMRRLLIDYARQKRSQKRGGQFQVVALLDHDVPALTDPNVEALNDALDVLAKINPENARILTLKFFTGLTIDEIAEGMAISRMTVLRRLKAAKAWLFLQLTQNA